MILQLCAILPYLSRIAHNCRIFLNLLWLKTMTIMTKRISFLTGVLAFAAALVSFAPGLSAQTFPENQWTGRRVAFLGDSITDESQIRWSNNVYWNYLADLLGFEPYVYGVSGDQMHEIIPQAERMEAELGQGVDAIFVFIGTNDYNASVPMGEWYSLSERKTYIDGPAEVTRTYREISYDGNTFRGRTNMVLNHLKTHYPDKQIILLTPIHRAYAQFGDKLMQPSEAYSNGCGLFIEDYVEAVREAGQIWSVPVIDLFSLSGLSPMVEEQGGYFRNPRTDRLHPGTRGHMRLAYTLAYQLLALPSHFPKYVALSFDDGPNTVTTPKVLDLLERHAVRASFFVIGQNIEGENIPVMQRAARMGCDIENHSYSHSFMSRMDAGQLSDEIDRTSDLVERYTGRRPTLFRPPYIDHNKLMHDTIDLTFICGLGSNDWEDSTSVETRARLILDNVRDGDLLLLHDFAGNDKTVEALEYVIPELKRRGFTFVTVPELFEIRGAVPPAHNGRIYTNCFD